MTTSSAKTNPPHRSHYAALALVHFGLSLGAAVERDLFAAADLTIAGVHAHLAIGSGGHA